MSKKKEQKKPGPAWTGSAFDFNNAMVNLMTALGKDAGPVTVRLSQDPKYLRKTVAEMRKRLKS